MHSNTIFKTILFVLATIGLATAGCSSSDGPAEDAGVDAGVDAGDGGSDAGDQGTDGGDNMHDPCLGVVCDQPEDSFCGPGEGELSVYEAIGDCDYATGECVYDTESVKCINGCENAACVGVDLCTEPLCNRPPSAICGADGTTITRFDANGTCDPDTGRCEYPSSDATCEFGCRFGRCLPPAGSAAALKVPANSELCTYFWGGDILANFEAKGVLSLETGIYPLVLDGSQFEVDWTDSLEISPGGAFATENAQGLGQARFEGNQAEGKYILTVSQPFTWDASQYALEFTMEFGVTDGRLDEPLMELTPARTGWPVDFRVEGQYQPPGLAPTYSNCELPGTIFQLEFTAANDDVIYIEYGYAALGCPAGMACAGEPFPGRIVLARLTRGATVRTVTDFFSLDFTTVHHSDGKSYLFLLESPLEGIHAVLIPVAGTGGEAEEIRYLDETFGVMSTSAIVARTGTE